LFETSFKNYDEANLNKKKKKTSNVTAKHRYIRRSKSESKDKPIAPVITFLCVSCNSGSLHITSIESTCGSRPGGI
jgi:hypothetical protein